MEERLRFVARLLDGEGMSEVCRSFGISRKTGYKIYSPRRTHLTRSIRITSSMTHRSSPHLSF